MKNNLVAILLITIGTMTCAIADRPYTEFLISQEIGRLGGETEAPSGLIFIAFDGENFRDEQFEMLVHCSRLEWFSADNVKGTADSLRHIASLKYLKRVDIRASGNLVEGLTVLSTDTKLEELYLYDLKVSKPLLKFLGTLSKLQKLHLEMVKVPHKSLPDLQLLSNRCDLYIDELRGLSESDLNSLKIAIRDNKQKHKEER
jgi:hypothetical protein